MTSIASNACRDLSTIPDVVGLKSSVCDRRKQTSHLFARTVQREVALHVRHSLKTP
jgi:hypothetical protein